MKCRRCEARVQEHHVRMGYDLCGICQAVEEGTVRTERPAAIDAHFNRGLGVWVEDRDDFKRKKRRLIREGVIADDGLGI